MRKKIAAFVLILAANMGIAVLFRLSWQGWIVLCLVGGSLIPVLERIQKKVRADEKEYEEVTLYMEQVLCSYRRLHHLRSAWEDCLLLYENGSPMGKAIAVALNCLKSGESTADNKIVWNACCKIHNNYNCERLVLLHDFLCRTDKTGGDAEVAIDILLGDLQLWKRRKSLFHTREKIIKKESTIAVFLSLAMCCFSCFMMPSDLAGQLINSVWYQVSTVIVICLLMIVWMWIVHKLSRGWLDDVKCYSENEQKKQYAILKSCSRGLKWYMAKKYCIREAEGEFSYWLLSVTLYLQQGSVYQALVESLGQIKGMFREEVALLIQRVYDDPVSLVPYIDFFKELEMEEIQSGMKLLYAAGNNEYRDVSRQIHILVEQNNLIMDKFEQNRQDVKTAGMGVWKQLPLLLAAVKVIIDMAILLVFTMERYSFW